MAILGYTGLRKGEILALKWNDISLKESLIHVKRSIVIAGTSIDNPGIIKSPKTEAGIRMVPIAEPLKKILISHKTSDEFIITNQKTGRPVHNGSDFETMWRHIGSQIDLGPYTSHSFRHAMCSTLLSSGVDVKTAQTILGHSQPSTTLNIYAHAIPNKVKEASIIAYESIVCLCNRYAESCDQLEDESALADNYRTIAYDKPKTLWQALLLMNIIYLAQHDIEGTGLRSLGRMDELLYPFYIQDITRGKATRDQIKELFKCYFYRWNCANVTANIPITLCGLTDEFHDVSSDLTRLILEAYETLFGIRETTCY